MNKKLKYKWVIVVSIIAIVAALPLLYLFLAKCFLTSRVDNNRVEYLSENYVLVDDSSSDEYFEIASQGNSGSQIYIFGETHGFAKTQQFDLLFFKHLNKQYGVRHYFAEVFSRDAEILTTFLNTCPMDTTYLKTFISNVKNYIPQQFTQEYFDKWIALFDYNSHLSQEKKIIIHGILGGGENDKRSKSDILLSEFMLITDKFRNYNAENYSEVFYCSLGMMHALQDSLDVSGKKIVPFAARLKNAGYKVVSVIHIPLECDAYFPKGHGFPTSPDQTLSFLNADGPIYYYRGIRNLKKVTPKHSVALFSLNNEDSPYRQGVDLVGYRSCLKFIFGNIYADTSKATTDYLQYILLTRGQPAPVYLKTKNRELAVNP